MDLSDYARKILLGKTLDAKLQAPPEERLWGTAADAVPDPLEPPPLLPQRPPELAISKRVRVPPLAGFAELGQRGRILHAFANHELQAVEIFAWAILAYPKAPPEFLRGLARLMGDEQRHLRLYIERMRSLGLNFGDYPVSGYFWSKVESWKTPIEFVAAFGMTFEQANLDHAGAYAEAADAAKDVESAQVFRQVQREEVAHVRFAWTWLRHWKEPGESEWESYRRSLHWPIRPSLARTDSPNRELRQRAGLSQDFIDHVFLPEPQDSGDQGPDAV